MAEKAGGNSCRKALGLLNFFYQVYTITQSKTSLKNNPPLNRTSLLHICGETNGWRFSSDGLWISAFRVLSTINNSKL